MKKFYYVICLLISLYACSGNEETSGTDELITWKVEFNSNGGDVLPSFVNIKDQTTIQKPTNPKKNKFVFGGWFVDDATFEKEWNFATDLVVSNMILYAKWLPGPPTWTVMFDSKGGTAISPIQDVETGAKISRPVNPSKSGFIFNGWFTDDEIFTNEWDFSTKQIVSDTTLYAKWIQGFPNVTYNNLTGLVKDCADPYILKHEGKYYLYGTGGNDGIKVYRSDDMAKWSSAVGATSGYALHKNNVWGEKWFWAPEVYYLNGKFYMFYSAEEHIAVATSDSPLGPFTQTEAEQKPFHADIKEIDTHLFIDDNGKKYLYFVRFTNGNEIWVAELNDDFRSIKESTLKKCIGTSQSWEQSKLEPYPNSKVNEGPFILKHKGTYYLTYSANHYQNPNYGVGYATSATPLGPWVKYSGNPVLIGNDKIKGVGHHSFVNVTDGCQYIVYHSHNNITTVQPRKLAIDFYEFIPSGNTNPDILKVYGPTTEVMNLCSKE